MIEYMTKHPDKLIDPLMEHMEMLCITLILSLVIAALFSVIITLVPVIGNVLVHSFSVLYSIPSLALFAVLIPVTGLGETTAIVVLVAYNQYLLLRNFLAGFGNVNPGVLEAARGIGMTKLQVLVKIQVPLSKGAIFTGIQLAVVSTIGIGTIAACINAGGLGSILFDGLRTMNTVKIVWGTVLSAGLAILVNGVLNAVRKRMIKC